MPVRRALVLLIAGTAPLRVVLAAVLGLGIDESYMVAAGRHMQLGYFDHPPAAWWLSAGAAHLAGTEAGWLVRLPFIALFAVSTWLMFTLTARLFQERAGLWAAVAFNLAPVFGLTSGGWVLPDGPLLCALLTAAWCLVRALDRPGWGWWLAAGAASGVALLSKYSAGIVLVGALVYLITQPAHRIWLRRPQPYAAALVAALAFAPVVIWNAGHGWASFAFQGGRAGGAGLHPLGPLVALGGQSLFLLPWIWAGLSWAGWHALRRGPQDRGAWLMLCLGAGPVLLFTLIALWTRNVLFHWAAPGYLFFFPLLGRDLAGLHAAWPRRLAWGTAGFVVVALCLATLELRTDLVPLAAGTTQQAEDWTTLRAALEARGLLGQRLAGPNWPDTGKLSYALAGRPPVLCLNRDCRQFALVDPPAGAIGQDLLIIAPRQPAGRVLADYRDAFDALEALAPLDVPLPGGRHARMTLVLGKGFRGLP